MKLTKLLPLVLMMIQLCSPSGSTNTVHDPIHTALNIAQQVYGQVKQELQHTENVSKYTTMIQKQIEQINQLTNMISQDAEHLRRQARLGWDAGWTVCPRPEPSVIP